MSVHLLTVETDTADGEAVDSLMRLAGKWPEESWMCIDGKMVQTLVGCKGELVLTSFFVSHSGRCGCDMLDLLDLLDMLDMWL